jgi:lipopolysaccharide export system protein LptA
MLAQSEQIMVFNTNGSETDRMTILRFLHNKFRVVSTARFFGVGFAAILLFLSFQTSSFGQSVGAFSGFRSGNKAPIQIEADNLKVFDNRALAIFKGNVKVVQGNSLLKADELKVFYEKNNKKQKGKKKAGSGNSIKRLEVSGTVYIKSEDNEATSDRGSFQMKSEDVELIGNVVLTQGKNIMTGCRFRANLKTGIATMESTCGDKKDGQPGRVQMLFEPNSAKK